METGDRTQGVERVGQRHTVRFGDDVQGEIYLVAKDAND